MFGLVKQSSLTIAQELNAELRKNLDQSWKREEKLLRENERLCVEMEQLKSSHEQTKRGAKVLAAAVGSLHGVGARGIALNGIRK